MGALKEKDDPISILEAADFNPIEDKLLIVRRKAKVGIICLNALGEPGILVLTRSLHEKTRQLGPDFFGGTLKVGEKPLAGIRRELDQESGGSLELERIEMVGRAKRTRDNIKTITSVFLGTASCSEEGLKFGFNDEGDQEHSAASIVSLDDFKQLEAMPKKYRQESFSHAAQLVIPSLIESAQPIIIPPHLQEARW